ncbi:response regulator [Uliginosibacterium aquaticum]|uniref:Response regulator n=1 Tax=Uliginosibacterium aquaticum TaxID=2731212 RepID=A0ABX2ID26_9RHOO|nr:response regulator [Uliginosibacterium aquaticum]NSL53932.1 response regulator [Uliginosibacterium aquaticum]
MSKKILVVDDDPELTELLRSYLGNNSFQVETAHDGKAMHAMLPAFSPDLLILDLMLPGEDGLSLCRKLRAGSRLPILMLTARGDDMDRIIGLEMGADDYLPKPFNPRELLARIRSIMRRAEEHGPAERPARTLHFAGWTLDLSAHNLLDKDGIVIALSTGEFRLLHMLAETPNCVFSRDQLTDAIAGRDAGPFDRTIDVMISRLRRRLNDDARDPQLIKTVRSEGYILATKVEARA